MNEAVGRLPFDPTQYLGLWAIECERGQQLLRAIQQCDWSAHAAEYERKAAAGDADGQYRAYVVRERVALMELSGTMTKYGSSFSSNGSTIRMRQRLRQAERDETVGAILLTIDSPGGTIAGTQDLVAELQRVGKAKPIYAFVEDLAASAAYWAASAAKEIVANNPTALVGSIGTFFGVYDLAGLFAREGIKAIPIRTGKFKGAGFPGAEITAEQIANWQAIVDDTQREFSAGVRQGRRMTDAEVAAVADGRVFLAGDAVKLKLIDAIGTFDDVLGKAARAASASEGKRSRPMAEEKREAPQAATLAELKAALPKSTADFRERMLERGATLLDARMAWLDEREAALDAWDQKLGEREKAIEARDQKLGEREKAIEAREDTAKKSGGAGAKTVVDPDPKAGSQASGAAKEQFFAAVNELVLKRKCSRAVAISAVATDQPELHRRFVTETNAK